MSKRDPYPHLTALSRAVSAPSPLAHMTDEQLATELKDLGRKWDEFRDGLESMSGSPGEWMIERMSELETEQRRRKRELMRATLLAHGWTETIYGTFMAPGRAEAGKLGPIWRIEKAYARVTGACTER